MAKERTEAVVVRGVDFSETSRIMTFLAPDRGRFACMAKGVRRKGSALAPVLDTFNRVELIYYWKDGRGVQQLGEASLLDGFRGLKSDLEKATFAAFPLELAGKVAHENEPSEALYAALVQGLEQMVAWPGDARRHACWQAMQLLSAAGFDPSLTHCAGCGREVERPAGLSYAGGVACGACPRDRGLTRAEWLTLRSLQAARTECPEVADGAAADVLPLLRGYATHQLETSFRSVDVINQMFG